MTVVDKCFQNCFNSINSNIKLSTFAYNICSVENDTLIDARDVYRKTSGLLSKNPFATEENEGALTDYQNCKADSKGEILEYFAKGKFGTQLTRSLIDGDVKLKFDGSYSFTRRLK